MLQKDRVNFVIAKIPGRETSSGNEPLSSEAFYLAHTELLEMVAGEKPLADVFDKTVKLIESVSPDGTLCILKIVEQSDDSLALAAAPSLQDTLVADLKHINVRPEDGTCGQAVIQRKTIVSENVATDPHNTAYREIAAKYGIKSGWSVPVLDKSGKPLAVITCLYQTRYKPSPTKLRRFESMCQLIRLAIERNEASQELIQSNKNLKSAASATKEAVAELKTLNRAMEMLGSCNRTLIRADNENQLLNDICSIATEVGGYRMAWVGFAGTGEDKLIIPVAKQGYETEYAETIRLSWSETEISGKGPGGRTIRTGKPVICGDIASEDDGFVWKQEALARGFRSLVCLPLKDGKNCFGFISLLSDSVNAISDGELNLLRELADNVAFGVSALRSRSNQKKMQDTIVKIAQTVSGSTGRQFYQLLTKNMVSTLGASAGLIGKINADTDSVTTLAHVFEGFLQENVTYDLKGTPCSEVRIKKVCIFEDNLPTLFPNDHYLIDLGIRSYAGIALHDSHNEPVGVLVVLYKRPMEDPALVKSVLQIFAERAASEMARQEADARIIKQASLIDKARDAILTYDLEHKITFSNKSAVRLYGTLSEKSAIDLQDGTIDEYIRAFSATMENGEWLGELHQLDSNRKPLIVESRWTLVCDAKNKPISILAISTDITEHKNLERQFLRAQRLESIGTLAGGLAHDLNNVLAPISMSIELLRKSVSDDRGFELLDTIAQSSRRGADMISQILSFARGVEGRHVQVSGQEIVSSLTAIIRDTFPKSVKIETKLATDLWQINGDSTQLHQILLNLCVNARDAMPEGGSLFVSFSNENIESDYATANLDASPWPPHLHRSGGHWSRHTSGNHRQNLRSVFHNQGHWKRNRTRAFHHTRHSEKPWRLYTVL